MVAKILVLGGGVVEWMLCTHENEVSTPVVKPIPSGARKGGREGKGGRESEEGRDRGRERRERGSEGERERGGGREGGRVRSKRGGIKRKS